MNFTESIIKLREAIFLKKGTGQDVTVEEETLKSLEEHNKKMEEETARLWKEVEDRDRVLEESTRKRKPLREKVIQAVKAYQDALLELFREERYAENVYDERVTRSPKATTESTKLLQFLGNAPPAVKPWPTSPGMPAR